MTVFVVVQVRYIILKSCSLSILFFDCKFEVVGSFGLEDSSFDQVDIEDMQL